MSKKGGARHFSKPYIDQGLLFKALGQHVDLISDMKGYEILSRNSACDPKAMHALLPLVDALLELGPTAELRPQPLRAALLQLITQRPELNTSKFKGIVYVNLRAERIGILLFHVRRLARGQGLSACVSFGVQHLAGNLEKGKNL